MNPPEEYRIVLQTPNGSCAIETKSIDAFVGMFSSDFSKALKKALDTEHVSTLDTRALNTWDMYRRHQTRKNNQDGYSRIARNGHELDVIKCYLQGMNIAETVKWLRTNKGFVTSKSAIGRYWTVLHRLGIDRCQVFNQPVNGD